jgi:hypothetical protein
VKAAAGRDVRGARDVPLEQDVLLLHRRVGDGVSAKSLVCAGSYLTACTSTFASYPSLWR